MKEADLLIKIHSLESQISLLEDLLQDRDLEIERLNRELSDVYDYVHDLRIMYEG